MNTTTSADERIERLASQVRWLRLWAIGATVVPSVAVLVAMQSPQPKELTVERVTAREFTLVDEEGLFRGSLGPDNRVGVDESAVALTLFGPSRVSNSRVYVRAGRSGSQIQLSDSWNNTLAWMESGKEGSGFTAGSAPKGANGVTLINAKLSSVDGKGSLELKQDSLDPELSVDGKTALDQDGLLTISPVDGVVKK